MSEDWQPLSSPLMTCELPNQDGGNVNSVSVYQKVPGSQDALMVGKFDQNFTIHSCFGDGDTAVPYWGWNLIGCGFAALILLLLGVIIGGGIYLRRSHHDSGYEPLEGVQ